MTSTAQNIRKMVNSEMANLRSSGLLRRVAVDVGGQDQHEDAHAGDGHAGDHRVEHREQLLQAEEVPRRLRRVRRLVDVGQLEQRGVDEDREDRAGTRCMASAATNSTTSRCGHTWTLSCGVAFTSWIEPDLTTVSRRWVWPPGPVADRRRRRGGDRGAAAGRRPAADAAAGRRPRRRRRPAGLGRLRRARAGARGSCCRRRRSARRVGAAAGAPRRAAVAGRLGGRGLLRGPLRLACGGVRGSRSWRRPPRPTADRRCRRPCGPARSGWP